MSEDRSPDEFSRGGFGDEPAEAGERDEPPQRPAPTLPIVRDGWRARTRQRGTGWWNAASPNLRGSVYMMSALIVYAVMVGLFKYIGAAIPLVQILFVRQIIMTALIVLFTAGSLRTVWHTRRPGLQISRGLITLASMLCGFSALIHIPLAQATAISFSQVLFVTIAAVLFLKETVDGRRWAATGIGFVGVLIMLNPTGDGLNVYAILAVLGALFGAGITVSVRKLAASERTETILLWQGAVLIVMLAVPTWLWWVPPTTEQWLVLIALSIVGTAGQWLITRAYQVGEAAALAPLEFSRLLLATFTGFVFFAEVPALTTWIGAAFVIGATLYTIRKNARPQPPASA